MDPVRLLLTPYSENTHYWLYIILAGCKMTSSFFAYVFSRVNSRDIFAVVNILEKELGRQSAKNISLNELHCTAGLLLCSPLRYTYFDGA